jgi:hypothetical protein
VKALILLLFLFVLVALGWLFFDDDDWGKMN